VPVHEQDVGGGGLSGDAVMARGDAVLAVGGLEVAEQAVKEEGDLAGMADAADFDEPLRPQVGDVQAIGRPGVFGDFDRGNDGGGVDAVPGVDDGLDGVARRPDERAAA